MRLQNEPGTPAGTSGVEDRHPTTSSPLQGILQHMREGVAVCQMIFEGDEPVDFLYLTVNEAFSSLTGMGDVTGRRICEIFPSFREGNRELLERYGRVARGAPPEHFQVCVGELDRWFTITAFSHAPGLFTAIFTVDNDRIRRELEAHQNRQRLEVTLKAAGMGVWELTIPTGEIWWSPECHRVVGVRPEELTLAAYQDFIHPEDREACLRKAMEAAANGSEYTDEYRIIRGDGSVRWLFNLGRGVLDAQGRPYKLIGTVQDITDHKQMEARMLRAQRLDSVGRMAAGLAHDLNNDLTPILFGTDLLLKEGPSQEHRELLEMIRNSANHGSQILRNLLAFSRGSEVPLRPMSLQPCLTRILELIRRSFPENILIECDWQPSLPPILGDETQLHQAILNLCLNARDAMPSGGRLLLSLDGIEVSEQTPGTTPAFRRGTHLRLAVRDTGTGIAASALEHIFDPFFSTKPRGKGNGLGLPTTEGIVRSHRGFMQVESILGEGTTFRMLIPAAAN